MLSVWRKWDKYCVINAIWKLINVFLFLLFLNWDQGLQNVMKENVYWRGSFWSLTHFSKNLKRFHLQCTLIRYTHDYCPPAMWPHHLISPSSIQSPLSQLLPHLQFLPLPLSILPSFSLSLPLRLAHPPSMAAVFSCRHYITARAALLLIPWQPALSTHTCAQWAHILVFMVFWCK